MNDTEKKVQRGKKKKGLLKRILSFFLISRSVPQLIGKAVLMLVIPYAYLLLCGLVFDMLLRWYHMTTFIFISFVSLYLVAFVLIVLSIIMYRKGKAYAG